MNIKVNKQDMNNSISGFKALALIASYYRINVEEFKDKFSLFSSTKYLAPKQLEIFAKSIGLKSRLLEDQDTDRLWRVPLPVIITFKDGQYWCLVERNIQEGWFGCLDPNIKIYKRHSARELEDNWAGSVILVSRRFNGPGRDPQKYSLSWFFPALWRYRYSIMHAFIASLFIQIFSLLTPMFFQVVIDKVLVHYAYETLIVIAFGMIIIGSFDIMLQYLRSYVMTHTGNRIDAELSSRIVDHLLRLPISYFEERPVGHTIARLRELETIRRFLTGQGIVASIDLIFTTMLLAVLFFYSTKLASITLIVMSLFVVISITVRPALLKAIKEQFDCGSRSQQFLVEMVVGIQTIKAAAVERFVRLDWEDRLASFLGANFRATMWSSLNQGTIQYVSKCLTIIILCVGAYEVMNGILSIGALIAFKMIADQVVQPVLRLSQLWQDFQQVQVSVERIGDILNAQVEFPMQVNRSTPNNIRGSIVFNDVSFRYRLDTPFVISNVSLNIAEGEVVGVVGASGSGKSTLTKLIQRLHRPEKGQITINGVDIADMDPVLLRRQIGVVLQDNVLFNKKVYENIALGDPSMSRDRIIEAAKLAGAHEFITKLPYGYDTQVEERGSNLSGGQRQRIAIARSLATNPRLLIFDEATSALDYETEQAIQRNMSSIVKGRTVIIISHRLAAIRYCSRIVCMSDGKIVEIGTHEELIQNDRGTYAHYWHLQSETSLI